MFTFDIIDNLRLKFLKIAQTVDASTKDKIGRLYLKELLLLDELVINIFLSARPGDTWDIVGRAQDNTNYSTTAFWKKLADEILIDQFNAEELEFLIEKGEVNAVWVLFDELWANGVSSYVIKTLHTNSHHHR